MDCFDMSAQSSCIQGWREKVQWCVPGLLIYVVDSQIKYIRCRNWRMSPHDASSPSARPRGAVASPQDLIPAAAICSTPRSRPVKTRSSWTFSDSITNQEAVYIVAITRRESRPLVRRVVFPRVLSLGWKRSSYFAHPLSSTWKM